MTAEPDQMQFDRSAYSRITFLPTLEPLPLVDPTEAARFLNVRRHTLACYRNLDQGPVYYKFGRWIRYAWADLQRHAGNARCAVIWGCPELENAGRTGELLLVDTPTAARFLTLTRFCFYNYRVEGGGPRFCRFGRRVHYPVDELLRWAEQQRRQARH